MSDDVDELDLEPAMAHEVRGVLSAFGFALACTGVLALLGVETFVTELAFAMTAPLEAVTFGLAPQWVGPAFLAFAGLGFLCISLVTQDLYAHPETGEPVTKAQILREQYFDEPLENDSGREGSA